MENWLEMNVEKKFALEIIILINHDRMLSWGDF